MRLLGAGLIWTSLIYAGAVYSIKLKKRIFLLENTLLMLREMKMQMEYLNMPVCDMIFQMKTREYFHRLGFLAECCNSIEAGLDFPKAWESAVLNSSHYYKREETGKLLHLGTNLGRSNLSNQIDILNIHIGYFETFLKNAKIAQQKYGNMSLITSALLGCMFFIMVI